MKVLITGASGLLGSTVLHYATAGLVPAPEGRRIAGTFFRHQVSVPGIEPHQCDLTDHLARDRLLRAVEPNAILHMAAATDVDWCEGHSAESRRSNTEVPRALARWSAERGARLVVVSTDLVFDGKKGCYIENDVPSPLGVYGTTKAEGEKAVLEAYPEACVVRLALIYGWGSASHHRCFTDWILDSVRQGNPVNLFTDQFRSPIYAGNAAEALWELMDSSVAGLLHWGGAERADRYSFGLAMSEAFGFDRSLLKPGRMADHPFRSPRPPDCSLDITRARALLETAPLTITDGLSRMVEDQSWLSFHYGSDVRG